MFRIFRDMLYERDRQAGRRYASEIISDMLRGATREEARKLLPVRPERDRLHDSGFNSGWCIRWQEQGRDDAAAGMYRHVLAGPLYDMGWWNEMCRRHDKGWSHRSLEAKFQEMRDEIRRRDKRRQLIDSIRRLAPNLP